MISERNRKDQDFIVHIEIRHSCSWATYNLLGKARTNKMSLDNKEI